MAEATQQSRTSRVGKRPVPIVKGVDITINGATVSVKGPKGSLSRTFPDRVSFKKDNGQLLVACDAPGKAAPRLQGLARALLANMVQGVTQGYEKRLVLVGTGYRAELKGKVLHCSVGFSGPKLFPLPNGLDVELPKDKKGALIILRGVDKEVVGQAAATIRSFRPPEPYGGKGVRYEGERVREKAGKAGK